MSACLWAFLRKAGDKQETGVSHLPALLKVIFYSVPSIAFCGTSLQASGRDCPGILECSPVANVHPYHKEWLAIRACSTPVIR